MYSKRIYLAIIAGSVLFASCAEAPDADSAEASEAKEVAVKTGATYNVDLGNSTIEWIGTSPVKQHHGILKIQDGDVMLAGGTLNGGKFTIDVKSLQPDDQNEEYNTKLKGHLLSDDFFSAETYPVGSFEITSVKEGVDNAEELKMKDATHMITGNLTLKGTTKSITFPAKVNVNEGRLLADANFNIDRTQWGVLYGSDESLGDKLIHHDVNLEVHLEANEQM